MQCCQLCVMDWYSYSSQLPVMSSQLLINVATTPPIPPSPRLARTRKLKAIAANPIAVTVMKS